MPSPLTVFQVYMGRRFFFNEKILKIASEGVPLYIWGAGSVGTRVFSRLKSLGVDVKGYVTEISGGMSPEELKRQASEYAIVRGVVRRFFHVG